MDMNKRAVITNAYQGKHKRVLCVCSGGVLRSPTAAWVLSNPPYDHNTRAAGTEDYALIRVDEALIEWADEIVCLSREHEDNIKAKFPIEVPVFTLDIPDNFAYRAPRLISMIKERYDKATGVNSCAQNTKAATGIEEAID